ncbi:phosphoheptose isomerase [Candidatus Nitrosopelagicus brevis]|uniref:Phosphoheptose isomerase n=1 Tax=Candidatus Nitrosopelagicus brevis TaxID=1410606 RepID=A0A0A7V4S8_9ARCH|nr:SIS domain-containing protein [Candidatus Nitrosopelagicus brevis]AJA93191.1 SIS domain protein [Candidatus Nitrosopelagicus brevis]MAR69749.1 SIS domain-containing protein [Nitrospina sp.]PTL87433.1 phosphoheptose isomerase [Candidatus Nitrosopelagicus brevis]|tara:strand:+ start:13929 stop:14519 length:591 start_codon:yes stop_codon:yes gene_type:complete
MTDNDDIIKNLDEQINCISKIKSEQLDIIEKILEVLETARKTNQKIILFGNGGSASTSSHFASDLQKTSIVDNANRFRAICLTDNIPVLTAWANDTSYEDIFSSQLENFLDSDDVVLAISGSGNSPNVVKAVELANKMGAKTISLTGKDGGMLSKISKINLNIPNSDMLTIETMHLLICHLLTTLLRKKGNPAFSY